MRKFLTVFLTAALVLSLTACGDSNPAPEITDNSTSSTVTDAEASPASDFEYEFSEDYAGMIITKYVGNAQEVNIPAEIEGKPVTVIVDSAFREKSLSSVIIPDSVAEIGMFAFYGCTSLASVTIPDGVTAIKDCAFSSCRSLTSITIPDSVTQIGYGAFYGCTSLASVTIPDNVTEIGDEAFGDCENITVTYKGVDYTYDKMDDLPDGIYAVNG